uniref:SWIM-type domain-containing protein n=1 Tax=Lactuca sativa TaxID=4236 RepID=A0A9R1W584_LACSA|nr:hypothetical protein LSAT_V11C300137710 [Lactuca sativa]
MFNIWSSWIPSYLRDFKLSIFSKFLHLEANFLDFIVPFENVMEKHRHNQCLLDHQSLTTNPIYRTFLPIERFAAGVYTHSNFFIVQKEIFNSIWSCFHLAVIMENEVEVYLIKDKKKSSWKDIKHKRVGGGENYYSDYLESLSDLSPSNYFKVMFNQKEDFITCSCMLYIQQGFICRHIFYVFNIKEIDIIPSNYILRRWRHI